MPRANLTPITLEGIRTVPFSRDRAVETVRTERIHIQGGSIFGRDRDDSTILSIRHKLSHVDPSILTAIRHDQSTIRAESRDRKGILKYA